MLTQEQTTTSTRSDRQAPKISIEQLERSFSTPRATVQALGPIDLTVQEGEFVCVVGPSGCGKSTLLRVLAGLLSPTSGAVRLEHGDSSRALTSVVFQDYGIYSWKTVERNVTLGLEIRRERRSVAKAKALRWLHAFGLTDFRKAYPATLSGGMRQRVSIARALAVEPEVLLMDEPFAALDAQMRRIMQEELLELWQEDRRTVIFVTHNLDEAILLGDRVVVMGARPGRVIADVPVPFPRPRPLELRGTPEFAAMEEQIWNLLREQIKRATPLAVGADGEDAR